MRTDGEGCLHSPTRLAAVLDYNHDMAACQRPSSCAIRRQSYGRDDVLRCQKISEIHEMIADCYWKQQLSDGAFIFMPLSHLIYHAVPSASMMIVIWFDIWNIRLIWRYFDIFGALDNDHSGTSLWWNFPMASHRNVACVPRWQLGTGASDVYIFMGNLSSLL